MPTWDLTPDISIYTETVHRLSELGAVVTHISHGDLARGLRRRVADDRHLHGRRRSASAAAKCSTRQTSTPRSRGSKNCSRRHRGWKTRQAKRMSGLHACFAARDWDAMAEVSADDIFHDDRRRVVGAGLREGRDAVIAECAALAEIGVKRITFDRHCDPGQPPRPHSFARLGPRPASRGVPHRCPQYRRDRRRRANRGARHLRPRRHRRRHSRNSTPDTSPAKPPPTRSTWSVDRWRLRRDQPARAAATTPDCVNIDRRREIAIGRRRPDRIYPRRSGPRPRLQGLRRGRASADQPRSSRHLRST